MLSRGEIRQTFVRGGRRVVIAAAPCRNRWGTFSTLEGRESGTEIREVYSGGGGAAAANRR